jgi:integrase
MSPLTRQDFEPTHEPLSLKDLIINEMAGLAQTTKSGEYCPSFPAESMDDLVKAVFAKFERQALEKYHSSEPWALRQFYLNFLYDDKTPPDEVIVKQVDDVMKPMVDWQKEQPFDPLKYLLDRLETERKSEPTILGYKVTAARFVAMCGRKKYYTDEDIMKYLGWASKQFKNANTYHQECTRVVQFLRRMPNGKSRELPMGMPKPAIEFYQPTLSVDDVNKLIWACVLDPVKPNFVVRLAVASIYGARRGELMSLTNENFDLHKATIFIKTEKRGQRKPQPIPIELLPLFNVKIQPMGEHAIQDSLRRACNKAGVLLPRRAGFHSFRRRTATEVHEVEPSDINTSNFMRWSVGRGSMLSRYVQTPTEESDKAILEKHPFVRAWIEAVPYILKFNPHYRLMNHNDDYTTNSTG